MILLPLYLASTSTKLWVESAGWKTDIANTNEKLKGAQKVFWLRFANLYQLVCYDDWEIVFQLRIQFVHKIHCLYLVGISSWLLIAIDPAALLYLQMH